MRLPEIDWGILHKYLCVIDRQMYRTRLGLMRAPYVSETTIHQSQAAGHDQHDCHNFDCVHLVFPHRDTLHIRVIGGWARHLAG